MHSRMIDEDPEQPTWFHYSRDLSGDVVVVVPTDKVETVPGAHGSVQVKVPGRNLEGFILEVLRDRTVSRLEEMTTSELRAFLFQR